MNRLKVTLLCLLTSVQIVFCSSEELRVEQFEELVQDDHLEKAFGRNPLLEEPLKFLTDTRQIVTLARELLSEDKQVTTKTETQAAHFTSTALTKKNEKEERQATLRAQLAIYETQIEKSMHLKESIEHDIAQYARLLEDNEQALEQIALSEEKAHKELANLDCVDSPVEIRGIAKKLVQEYGARKKLRESEREERCLEQKRLRAALVVVKTTLAELIIHRRRTFDELSTVNNVIEQLDTTLLKIDEKYMTSSPVLCKEEQ